ncbi:SAF domain-containing protein [Glycomyces sp. MUSA5-2]|uniref:SAF domain-containing protein n=1 Tax=Glycomyces sp. MUSA5-2 TaxID=2053002 RepID=UPI00300944B6
MSGNKQGADRPERPGRRSRRRIWVHIAGAAAVVLCCAAAVVWTVTSEPDRASVLRVASTLAAGQVIAETDLAPVDVAADEVDPLGLVPSSAAASVVGQLAAIPLAAGTLLSASMVGTPSSPREGWVEVTVALADGRVPAALQPGHLVSLLGASDTAATGVWSAGGTVTAVAHPEEGGALVTVELPAETIPGLVSVEATSLLMVATAHAAPDPEASPSPTPSPTAGG